MVGAAVLEVVVEVEVVEVVEVEVVEVVEVMVTAGVAVSR